MKQWRLGSELRSILEIGSEEHAGGLHIGWGEERMDIEDNYVLAPLGSGAFSEMGMTNWERNGFGNGSQELALDEFSLRILLVIPVEVSGIQLAMGLSLWRQKSAFCNLSEPWL